MREHAGLTQEELGDQLGVLNTTVHHYEHGTQVSKDKLSVYAELATDDAAEFLDTLATGDVVWAQVNAVKQQPCEEPVYDLTVPGNHTFIANNTVVHNTTTIAKIASRLRDDYGVVLAAGDTFRSAAIDQLEEHGENLGLKTISHEYDADPAAVIYDAVEHADKEDADVVLADTAGRSHTDKNLMDQLAKVVDVNEPDLRILVVDALAGNDVVEQAEQYEEIGFDGIVLTKVDVDKNGGAALSLGYLTGKPIMYLGTGQQYEDLEEFDADTMVDRLLE